MPPSCRMAIGRREWHIPSRLPVDRIHELKPGRALELARRIVAGRRVDVALAGLAQEARVERHPALRRHLLAVLLEEDAADRGFAGLGGQIRAGPAGRI